MKFGVNKNRYIKANIVRRIFKVIMFENKQLKPSYKLFY